jgi:superfamily II DNA or RNA helicase
MATLRERNNQARRECYQRQKEMAEWLLFEHRALNEHVQCYGHVAWHASVLPENELYEAGLIHNFNEHRMNRIRMRREREGKAFQYRDYGMDFLAKSPSGTYHACQAKHYTTRKVTANDVGTFLAILMGQLPNTGYLYTSGPVEVNFRECVQNSKGRIIHHSLPFKAPRAAPAVPEPALALRPYQVAAIEAAMVPGKNVLDIACGLGKTVILGHILKATSNTRIICAAPMRISVQNLMDRLSAFLPTHRHLLVDSDAGGTTDLEVVRTALADASPLVIYTTFSSLLEVVHPVATQREYLVVDEVHNVVHRTGMCAVIDAYAQSLCLSATIPEELYEQVDATCIYRYNVAEGIRDGYICDYEVVLPYIVTAAEGSTHVDVRVPAELGDDANAWIPKALFLATGMFLYGCRRCVVYLPSCDDCDAFKAAMSTVMERYHGSTLWCESITHAVGAKERTRLLDAFQTDDAFDKYIVASVRILDEAVDLPACDSEYITHIGDATSDIRTVQRLLRGSRLDPSNPSKKNHLFIWTDDTSRVVNALSLLKEADPTFHSKMRVLHTDYDSSHQVSRREDVKTQMGELRNYLEVRCMTLAERWEVRRLEWVAQYERLNRVPKQKATDPDEKRASQWQSTMRRAYAKFIGRDVKTNSTITADQVDILTNTPGWLWDGRSSKSKTKAT